MSHAMQDGQVIVKPSDKMWSTGRENAKHTSILALTKNPMDSMKKQKDMTLEAYFLHLETPGLPACYPLIIIREMQVKAMMRDHLKQR